MPQIQVFKSFLISTIEFSYMPFKFEEQNEHPINKKKEKENEN